MAPRLERRHGRIVGVFIVVNVRSVQRVRAIPLRDWLRSSFRLQSFKPYNGAAERQADQKREHLRLGEARPFGQSLQLLSDHRLKTDVECGRHGKFLVGKWSHSVDTVWTQHSLKGAAWVGAMCPRCGHIVDTQSKQAPVTGCCMWPRCGHIVDTHSQASQGPAGYVVSTLWPHCGHTFKRFQVQQHRSTEGGVSKCIESRATSQQAKRGFVRIESCGGEKRKTTLRISSYTYKKNGVDRVDPISSYHSRC